MEQEGSSSSTATAPTSSPSQACARSSIGEGALAARADWWLMAGELNPAWGGGHGGAEETAAVMAVDPSLVDSSELGPMALANDISDELPTSGWDNVEFKGAHVAIPRDACRYAGNGWIGPDDPANANPEWGRPDDGRRSQLPRRLHRRPQARAASRAHARPHYQGIRRQWRQVTSARTRYWLPREKASGNGFQR